jgi:3-isopropylmalate/(R)-2-methylmalate dehydratase large subunit
VTEGRGVTNRPADPAALRFAPRLLLLAEDPAAVRRQLAGEALSLAEAGPLRADISTDEIIPLPAMVHFDATLGRWPHTGFTAGGERPIGRDAIRSAGIEVLVGGRRYGKGSSREHAVVAERAAGVRLVIAESFERIYRQNADNLGLFTSTDFGLIERIRRGEAIALDDLLAGRDALAAAILRAGGLLAYGERVFGPGVAAAAVSSGPALPEATGPLTLFEKIVRRHWVASADTPSAPTLGEGGFVRADRRFIHEYYTGMAAWMLDAHAQSSGRPLALHDAASIVTFEDHLSYVHASPVHVAGGLVGEVRGLSRAHRDFVARFGLTDHGYLQALEAGDPANRGSEGISHALMAERYARPGELIVGTDSHTPHSGALGCVAYGVGTTDMANAFLTGVARLTLPPVLRIELTGALPEGVSAKDLVLHLLADPAMRAGAGVGRVFEYGGPALAELSTDERATLTNMVAELGGFTGLVEPDAETLRFLRERRGPDAADVALEPWMRSDPGAAYERVFTIDCSRLEPMVARPGDPGRGVALSALAAEGGPVPIHIAYGGSCTAGKREDFAQYHAVLAWAAARGLRVAPGVRLYLQFGTADVRSWCEQQGFLPTFAAVGAELLEPACGACANCGPGASTDAAQVTVSAINRNFPGRSGPGSVWLASPATVAASAIAGELLSFDALRRRHQPA